MANKLLDAIRGIFGKKPEHNLDSTGKPSTSAAPASTQTTTQPTNIQPQQKAPVYKDNTIVYKNEQGNGGLYQYKSPDKFKTQDEINQQWKYAMQLGYDKDTATELLRNGTRWKDIALGQNGRPIISYQGGKYTSQDEIDQQYALGKSMGMSHKDVVEAMRQGTRWREQTDEDVRAERAAASYGNTARDNGGMLGGVTGKANDRQSSLYGSKYYDLLNKSDFEEKSQAGESKIKGFGFKNDERYDYINNIGNEREQADVAQRRGTGARDFGKYQFMTEDEVGVYNYLYATKGKVAADQFLEYLDPELNAQWASGASANNAEIANSSGWNQALYSGMTVMAQPVRTLTSLAADVQDAVDVIRGNEIDPNSGLRTVGNMTADVRQAISEDLKKKATEAGGSFAGGVAEFAYNTTMSALDSTINGLFAAGLGAGIADPATNIEGYRKAANVLGSALMSSEVMSQAVREGREKGYNSLGALTLGLTRGGIEYMSEELGGDWIIKKARDNPANYFNVLLHAMIPEGVEEVMSDVGNEGVNLLIDSLFGTEESSIGALVAELQANGYEGASLYWEALKHIIVQEALSFAGGAFAAFGSGSQNYIGSSRAINHAALTLNTDRAGIVDLYTELKANNANSDIDVGVIDKIAQLYDVNSVEEFRAEIANHDSVQAAIDAKLIQAGEQEAVQEQQAAQTTELVQQDEDLPELRAIAYDDITGLSDEQLQKYTNLLNESIAIHQNGDEQMRGAAVTSLEADLQAAMDEGTRRQNIREAEAQQTETQPEEAPAAEEQPTQPQPTAPRKTLLRRYNSVVKHLEELAPGTYTKKTVRGMSDAEIQSAIDEVNERIRRIQHPEEFVEQKKEGPKKEAPKAQPALQKTTSQPVQKVEQNRRSRYNRPTAETKPIQRKTSGDDLPDSGGYSRPVKPPEVRKADGTYALASTDEKLKDIGQTKRPLKEIFEEMRDYLSSRSVIQLIRDKIELGTKIGIQDPDYLRSDERKEDIDTHAIMTKEVGARMSRYSGFEDISDEYWDYEKKRYARNDIIQEIQALKRRFFKLSIDDPESKLVGYEIDMAQARLQEAQAILGGAEVNLLVAIDRHNGINTTVEEKTAERQKAATKKEQAPEPKQEVKEEKTSKPNAQKAVPTLQEIEEQRRKEREAAQQAKEKAEEEARKRAEAEKAEEERRKKIYGGMTFLPDVREAELFTRLQNAENQARYGYNDSGKESEKRSGEKAAKIIREEIDRRLEDSKKLPDASSFADEELDEQITSLRKLRQRTRNDIESIKNNPTYYPNAQTRLDYLNQLYENRNKQLETLEAEQKRRKANGSNQGDRQDNSGTAGSESALGARPDSEDAGSSETLGENTRARRTVATDEESGDSGSTEERAADTAAERTGGRGNAGNQTVQRSVSKKYSGRVSRQVEALFKHFNIDKFMDNPFKHMKKMRNAGVFASNTLRSVFGSQEKSSKFVNAWMSNEINNLSVSAIVSQARNADQFSKYQASLAKQVFSANRIIQDFLGGHYTAQDIADIGGFSLEEAQAIVDGAEDNIIKWMAEERILKANGDVNDFEFRKKSLAANKLSGINNTVANIANEGADPGTAQTFETIKRYEAKSGDVEYAADNDYGNTVYRRGSTFYVVNKKGYIVSEAYDATDAQNALRYARMVARKNSPSYDVASVRLFDRDVYQNTTNGEVLSTKAIFKADNMKSVYGSLASDIMKVAYTDADEGVRRGTSAWFKLDLSVKSDPKARTDIKTLSQSVGVLQHLIEQSMVEVEEEDGTKHRGMKMDNGKYYVFFGMTSSGAKKGECIMVDMDYYDELRTASLGGKAEKEVTKFNPAKYLTASCSIFTPSNADTGIKIAPDFDKNGMDAVQVAVIGDVYTTRFNTLRQFMFVDRTKNVDEKGNVSVNLASVDYKTLVDAFSTTMIRQLTEQGVDRAEAERRAAEVVPNQVKEIMAKNDVGSIINMVTDLMFQATDGTGFVDLPEGSPYQGQSIQFRSLGGFKGQLIGFHFSDYLHHVIPFNENAEYLYTGEDGKPAGGFRYQSKERGVEVLSLFKDETGADLWIPVKQLKAILFDSTVKFAGQYANAQDFYRTVGNADLRSIPRENVYGSKVSDSALEGYETRGLGQALRSQTTFTEDEIKAVLAPTLTEVVDKIMSDDKLAAKFIGVDLDGPPPTKSDGKLHALYYQYSKGHNYLSDFDARRWVYDKLGRLFENYAEGQVVLKEGQVSHGFINPDVIGLIHSMTAITRIAGDLSNTEGGGFSLEGYSGLKPGEIFSAEFTNEGKDGKKDGTTALVRYPTMKAIDVQIRNNIGRTDPAYREMIETYGLDKGNVYVAINDTLSMYLDNDYDGDSVLAIQGAYAEFYKQLRSRDYLNTDGTPMKKNVLYAATSGIESKEVESEDFGPVEFSHAKAGKQDILAKYIKDAVYKYLQVNDMTEAVHKGPRTVGIYANMVDRLAAIPDWALENTIKAHPDKYGGMTARDLRNLMEARFGVACVLSIDFAKTGQEFSEFFSLVDSMNATLFDIAEENGIIPKREADENGNKSTKSDLFIPSWWEFGGNFDKMMKAVNNPDNVAKGSQSAREAIVKLLDIPEEKNGKRNWFDKFAYGDKEIGLKGYGKGFRTNATWEGAMTADISSYSHLSNKFFIELDHLVNQINSKKNPEFSKVLQRYKKAKVEVKDMTVLNYLLYQGVQKSLGLTNAQFTDLMLAMLSRNAKTSGTSHSIGIISNFDQHEVGQKGDELSSAKLFSRNIALANDFEYASKMVGQIYSKVEDAEKALLAARKSITEKLNQTAATVSTADADKIARIADVQKYLEDSNRRFRNDFNNLYKANKSLPSITARQITIDSLAEYKDMYQNMLDQITNLSDTLGMLRVSGSKFSVGVSEYISDIYGDAVKEIRDIMRDIDTLEDTLDGLYSALSKQIAKTSEAAEATAGVFTEATTGLEGLTEEQILDKIRGALNASNTVRDAGSGRENVQNQNTDGQTSGQRESNTGDTKQPEIGRGTETGRSVKVNTSAENEVQSGKSPKGIRTIATTDEGKKLAVTFGKDGSTVFTCTKKVGDTETVTETYTLKGGKIIPNTEMTQAQKKTQEALKRVGIHIIYTTSDMDDGKGGNVPGFAVKGKDVKSGERFIVANITGKDGHINARHETIHALLDMLGEEKALEWMQSMEKALTASQAESPFGVSRVLTKKEIKTAKDGIKAIYGGSEFDILHEFFANLFSRDNFCGAAPELSAKYYKKFGPSYTSSPLTWLFDEVGIGISDKFALMNFMAEPIYAEQYNRPATYARVSNEENAEESTVAEETTAEEAPEAEPTAEEQPNEQPQPPKFNGRRRNIAKNILKVQTSIENVLDRMDSDKSLKATQTKTILQDFVESVHKFLEGEAFAKDLYVAYNNLKGTMYYDETVEPYFSELADPRKYFVQDNKGGITGMDDAYNEAVDHAFAKLGAFATQVMESEKNTQALGAEAVKREEGNAIKKVADYLTSWQINAPTWFKSLVGYKKGTVGYKLAQTIEHSNKMMQRHFWGAYQHLEKVAKMSGYQEFVKGEGKNNQYYIEGAVYDGENLSNLRENEKGKSISTIQALNLLRMLKSVRYTQNTISNVFGFTFKDSEGNEFKIRPDNIQRVMDDLEDYFSHRGPAVARAYYQATNGIFDYFTPEVQRIGMKLNGFVDMIPSEFYSPVSWGRGNFEENFDPKEAQLKQDPRYMKSRVEEAGGYLNAASMADVMETYIRRMSDYLAFGEAREQFRLMNKTAERRDTKTLGQIAGENMGANYARFINNYVRDFIHYSENTDSFWYKARMNMQKGVLVGNPSVMMKQSASYFNAASVIDMKYLMRALTPSQFGKDYANGKSGLLEYRRITGDFDPTISEMFGKKVSKYWFVRAFQNGISFIDYQTVKRLYVAACLKVQAETDYKVGSAQFDEAVENIFSDAAITTQPQFDPSLRGENARTTNEGVRMLSMFRTQQGQNFNKILTAFGERQANPNAQTKAQFRATISGLVCSGLALAIFASLSDAALHRKKKYRDDEGEVDAKKVFERLFINSAEAMAGTAWFGDDLAKAMIDTGSKLMGGDTKEFYGVSMGPLSTFSDMATATIDLVNAMADGKGLLSASKKLAGYALQLKGFPANNIYNYINTVVMYSKDYLGTNPEDFDDWMKWMDDHNKAQKKLIRAAETGNDNRVNNLWETLQKRYDDPKRELNTQLKKDYMAGNVSEDTAENLLVVYGGLEDTDAAKKRVELWDFIQEYPEYADLSEGYVHKWNEQVEPAGIDLAIYYDAVQQFKAFQDDKTNGKDRSAMLNYIEGLNLTANQKATLWGCFGEFSYNAYDAAKGIYGKYESFAKPANIPADVFAQFYDKANSLEADKDKDGKSIRGSLKKKVIKYINSLNLSKEQKDALYKSMNYSTKDKDWKTRPWR